MKKLMLMLVRMLPLPFTANMARTDDFDDALATYQNGDYATAFKLFKPLAEQGNANAQHNLGLMYDDGEGVIQDDKEAVKWYRLAAEQGHAMAQNNLGLMYATSRGVLQDDKKAHMWWNIARANGEKENADHNIKSITQRMTPADIAKAQDMARQCMASNYRDC